MKLSTQPGRYFLDFIFLFFLNESHNFEASRFELNCPGYEWSHYDVSQDNSMLVEGGQVCVGTLDSLFVLMEVHLCLIHCNNNQLSACQYNVTVKSCVGITYTSYRWHMSPKLAKHAFKIQTKQGFHLNQDRRFETRVFQKTPIWRQDFSWRVRLSENEAYFSWKWV